MLDAAGCVAVPERRTVVELPDSLWPAGADEVPERRTVVVFCEDGALEEVVTDERRTVWVPWDDAADAEDAGWLDDEDLRTWAAEDDCEEDTAEEDELVEDDERLTVAELCEEVEGEDVAAEELLDDDLRTCVADDDDCEEDTAAEDDEEDLRTWVDDDEVLCELPEALWELDEERLTWPSA